MLILSLYNLAEGHDGSVVVAEDYEILAAVQTERITRVKKDAFDESGLTINEGLRVAGVKLSDVDALLTSRGFEMKYFEGWPPKRFLANVVAHMRGRRRYAHLSGTGGAYFRNKKYPVRFNRDRYMRDLGVCSDAHFSIHEHHFSHALSALFFSDFHNALLYTADGGGDDRYASAYHLHDSTMDDLTGEHGPHGIRGVHTDIAAPWEGSGPSTRQSIGLAYYAMTRALGYCLGHEGKLTGLSAHGEPTALNELAQHFRVAKDGSIYSNFRSLDDICAFTNSIAQNHSPQNAAASIQKLTEDIVLQSIRIYLQRTGARQVALAGGVFANVLLNQRIAALDDVDEVFIFPGMGDEGLAVGGLYQFLLERDGLPTWLSHRRRLENVYWGGAFDDALPEIFDAPDVKRVDGDVADTAAELLRRGKIVALFCGRMEFGPRALGARSILANPADKSVNDTLNQRLARTEFMPFAPFVLEEDADEVFEVDDTNRYAMHFMTITCQVRDRWRDKIPAVVHIDGSARPQIISDAQNPLYANILRRFKQKTGLPVLVNTSFNAHEEPIIHTPAECLRALRDERVDYVAAKSGVYCLR